MWITIEFLMIFGVVMAGLLMSFPMVKNIVAQNKYMMRQAVSRVPNAFIKDNMIFKDDGSGMRFPLPEDATAESYCVYPISYHQGNTDGVYFYRKSGDTYVQVNESVNAHYCVKACSEL